MDYNLVAYFALATASLAIGFILNRKMIDEQEKKVNEKFDKYFTSSFDHTQHLVVEMHKIKEQLKNISEVYDKLEKLDQLVSSFSLSMSCVDARLSQIEESKKPSSLRKI